MNTFKLALLFECLVLAYLYHMLYLNGAWQLSFTSAIFWILLLPTFIFYIIYGEFTLQMFLILSIGYVMIQQRVLIEDLRNIDQKIGALQRIKSAKGGDESGSNTVVR